MKNKTVIVIGGSKGLGSAICKKFLENEYIVINGSRSKPNINHKNFHSLKLDVRKEKNFLSFYKKVKKISKNIDVLINNTGISEWKSLENISNNFIYKLYETNVFYIFWSCKYALKLLKKNTSIINVSSIAGKRGSKNNSATGKLPTEKDVTDLIIYLASDRNQSLTGQCINLDSGVFPQ